MRSIGTLLVAFLVTETATADAAPVPTTRLAYVAEEATRCPDESVMRTLVATHLGYDPFRDDGSWLVRARIQRAEAGLVGHLDVEDDKGAWVGGRVLHAPPDACRDLIESMALATSLAIDPVTAPRPSPVAPREAPQPVFSGSVDLPAPRAAEAPRSAIPASRPVVPYAVLAAHGSMGGTPGPALGFTLGAGAELQNLSFGLEGRIDLPTETTTSAGGVQATQLSLLAVACFHNHSRLTLYGCVVGGGGPMWSRGTGVTQADSLVSAHAAVGLRFRIAWNMSPAVTLGVRAELLAALTRSELSIDDAGRQVVVWASTPYVATLGPDLSVRFP